MSTTEQAPKHVGQSLRRKEDPRLITGRAQYVDDIAVHGMLHMAVVRSPEAHARIVSIDTSGALAHTGITAVFTGEDMRDLAAPLPHAWAPPGVEVKVPERWPLARGEVKHVGDAVAMVIGEDKHIVVDAAQDVIVEYESLPVVVDVEEALKDEVLVHQALGTNKTHEWSMGGGDVDAAIAEADVVIERRIVNHRIAGGAIEPRGVIAEYRQGSLTVWSSTQVPHLLRLFYAVQMGIPEDHVRVIAPEVGGGFGSKLQVCAEETLCAWASKQLSRPVKWIETRSENMAVSHHGRDQVDYVRMAATSDGTITAFHANIIQDCGAYFGLLTAMIPELGAFVQTGCYKIPNVRTDITGVLTNKFITDAIRGAGRPEMTHMLEVMIDQLADELGMDRLELRRKNFIAPGDFPYTTPYGITYDSGNYAGTLDRALEMLDLDALRAEQASLREKGTTLRGVGFSTYTEICGLAPSRAVGPKGFGLGIGLYESALVRVHPTGTVTVFTGASPHGQGHETGFAQIVADRLGTDPSCVEVIHGDTATGPMGLGTYGSRSLAIGGVAAAHAAEKLALKCREIVAFNLEANVDDIEVIGGKFALAGDPDQGMTLAEVAGCAYIDASGMPEGMELGLEQTLIYDPSNFVFPFGAHICVVDVDVVTGKVDVVRWIAVDDCGPAINPMLIDGQVHGGVAYGIGQALYEQVVYDDRGQLVTGTFMDYALPTAEEIPSFATDRTVTPSPSNSLGVKGIGEAGTIAATPAIVNAVIDALRHEGVSYIDMPLTPMRVWQALEEARGRGSGPRESEQGRPVPEQAEGSAGSGPTKPEGGAA
ncbi:MAG: aerobic carbon-monoxide dehydrogenase large subunit [Solirubrobacteraceae bacterium]|nr:aerobic carbon-monoxide dehydrogenase large subunit [Solirubrobacteraceae bacterium]